MIRILSVRELAPACALGSGHGMEVPIDQSGVDPARVIRIALTQRHENLRGSPRLAVELAPPVLLVQARVERRGELFRLLAGGAAYLIGKRHDPARGGYRPEIASDRPRKNRGEAGCIQKNDGERCSAELAGVALAHPDLEGFELLRGARAHLAYLNDPPVQPSPDRVERSYRTRAQRYRVRAQPFEVRPQLFGVRPQLFGVGPQRLRVRAQLLGDRAQQVGEVSGPHAVSFFASGRLWRKPRSKCPRPARSPCSKIQV